MILLIDNYDSFTYNVYQQICKLTDMPVEIYRNDKITIEEIKAKNPDFLIISPGPGNPDNAGVSLEAVKTFAGKLPILGICLGHQTIGQAFGAKIIRAKEIVHGKVHPIKHDGQGLFRELSPESLFTRYHSLAIDKETLSDDFEITATTADGEIMGIRHKKFLIEGVQFHPESIGSEEGERLIKNFLHYKKKPFDRKGTLNTLISGHDLSRQMASNFMDELTDGNLPDIYIASVLAAITAKGVNDIEIAGCVDVLHAKKIKVPFSGKAIDIVGTGGDGLHTFNISSFSALITAACGAKVAKHGNRAVSSKSGSSQFYEALGINLQLSQNQAAELIEKENFAFLFAPLYHKSMRFAAPARAAMGVKTIMNLLGPLSNPAEVSTQLLGVYDEELCPIMANAAKKIGLDRVMVVHGDDGQDEISVSSPSRIYFIDENDKITDESFDPASIGIPKYTLDDIVGGTADENVQMARDLLDGKGKPALVDACCLNAGAALMVYGLSDSIESGYKTAKAALGSGKVKVKVKSLIAAGQKVKG